MVGFNPKTKMRESIGPDDAKLLLDLVNMAISSGEADEYSKERLQFLMAKLRRLSV